MSRIGNKVILIPEGVEVSINENKVLVKGKHGSLEEKFSKMVSVVLEENQLVVKRFGDSDIEKKIHGTTRSLLANMVTGVHERFKKQLEITGVGYRALMQGNTLVISAGYSHNFEFVVPEGIDVTLPKNTTIIIEGINKQVVGEFAANVRAVRKPEPYKGKGIRYADEVIRRKEGKTAQ